MAWLPHPALVLFGLKRHSVPEVCLSHPYVNLVLSLRLAAVWLSFLACTVSVVSWTPNSCHLACMIAAVACGLDTSSCASTLWVECHSVPEACLSHPWVDFVLSFSWPLYGSVPCFAVPAHLTAGTILDDSHKC